MANNINLIHDDSAVYLQPEYINYYKKIFSVMTKEELEFCLSLDNESDKQNYLKEMENRLTI